MAQKNRMTRKEYLEECEKVQDTAYADKGNPQTFGNELLLQNIAKLSTKVRALERSANDAELRIIGLEQEIALLSEEIENGKTHTHD